MKRRVYIRNTRFLRNFCILLIVLLIVMLLFVSSMYSVSMSALKKEIQGINENTTYELAKRIEDVMMNGNEIIATLAADEKIQLFFVNSEPDKLVEDYYIQLAGKLDILAASYVDSVILYAPEFKKMYGSDNYMEYSFLKPQESYESYDNTWLNEVEQSGHNKVRVFTRAKSNKWPFYITIMKRWDVGTTEGVILVNINLNKLYDYLLVGRSDAMQLYLIDDKERVILEENKQQLYSKITDNNMLASFRQSETFSELNIENRNAYAYVQVEMENYGLTCVNVKPISDYFVQGTRIQRQFVFVACVTVVGAMAIAFFYSVKIVKPLEDIQQLLIDPSEWKMSDRRYDEDIREIADQIVAHLQTNSLLREELDERLDLLKDAQMIALQTQIKPHFMFNTLNIASLMAESDCGEGHPVVQILGGLSDILRYSLSKNETVCIKEEISCVRKYLAIMKYRYGEFDTVIEVDEALNYCAIPKLILQPLVENALQHGISACLDKRLGSIKISVKQMQTKICIDVIDNGLGIDADKLRELQNAITERQQISKEHIGLSNVAQRCYLLFHDEQEIVMESTFGKGTCIRMIFPITPVR